MRVTAVDGRYRVTVAGALRSRDLRRLERACGSALEQALLPVTVRLTAGAPLDPGAKAYLGRLIQRGALVLFD
jgi:hypothetical protein